MNFDQLARNIGNQFRLRPKPIIATSTVKEESDEGWTLQRVNEKDRVIQLRHVLTGKAVTLAGDNVKEFRTPDFILLRCQLTVSATGVEIEPLLTLGARDGAATPLGTQLRWVDGIRERVRQITPRITLLIEAGDTIERAMRGDTEAFANRASHAAKCEEWRSEVGRYLDNALAGSGATRFVLVKHGPVGSGEVSFEYGRLVACLENLRSVQERLEDWIFRGSETI